MHWSKFHRKTLLTLGKNTNNRIKNFNKQLKHILLPGQHLSETIQRLVGTAMQLDIDRAYKTVQEIGTRIDASTHTLPPEFSSILTNLRTDLVAKTVLQIY